MYISKKNNQDKINSRCNVRYLLWQELRLTKSLLKFDILSNRIINSPYNLNQKK